MKVRKAYLKLLALLPIPFVLSSCYLSDCKDPSKHAHKYVHSDNRGTIVNYLIHEAKDFNIFYKVPSASLDERVVTKKVTYNWNEEKIELTNDDEEFYKVKDDLFNGLENWDYLYNIMRTTKDHIEYNYIYDDGEDKHSRWTNSYYWRDHHTGIVRVYHMKYYGYKIVYKDGKYEKVQSPYVDDFRDIIDDYPYTNVNCMISVYKEYEFNTNILGNLKLSDIDEFKQPDLSTSELHPNTK